MMDADGNTSQSSLQTKSETVLVTAGNQGGTVIAQVSDAVLTSCTAATRELTVVDVSFDSLSSTIFCAAGTSLAKATVTPTGRELKWELLNNEDVEATMMDADGNTSQSSLQTKSETVLVTAGNQGGTVIAQVSDAVLTSCTASTKAMTIVKLGLTTGKGIVCNRQITVANAKESYGDSSITVEGYNWMADTLACTSVPSVDHEGNDIDLTWTLMDGRLGSLASAATTGCASNTFTAKTGVAINTKNNTAVVQLRLSDSSTCATAPVRVVKPFNNWSVACNTGINTAAGRELQWWNAVADTPVVTGQPSIQLNNNCYSYAANAGRDYYVFGGAQPDSITSMNAIDVGWLQTEAQGDGFKLINSGAWKNIPNTTAETILRKMETAMDNDTHGHLVYGVVDQTDDPPTGTDTKDDERDYHWYRLEQNGKWSHKPGTTDAVEGVTDPRTTNSRQVGDTEYKGDAGFFWVPEPDTTTLAPVRNHMHVRVSKTYPAGYTGVLFVLPRGNAVTANDLFGGPVPYPMTWGFNPGGLYLINLSTP